MTDDLIKRSDAIKEITNYCENECYYRVDSWCPQCQREEFEETINAIPSADRPQEWIPCSEKLPANDDWVIISILDESGDTPYRYSDFGWYFERAKCWIVESEQRTDVVAWMPLPKPYKERSK